MKVIVLCWWQTETPGHRGTIPTVEVTLVLSLLCVTKACFHLVLGDLCVSWRHLPAVEWVDTLSLLLLAAGIVVPFAIFHTMRLLPGGGTEVIPLTPSPLTLCELQYPPIAWEEAGMVMPVGPEG